MSTIDFHVSVPRGFIHHYQSKTGNKPVIHPSFGEQVHKIWNIYTMKYYPKMKRNKLLNKQQSGWNSDITLSENKQTNKQLWNTHNRWVKFIEIIGEWKVIQVESMLVLASDWGWNWGLVVNCAWGFWSDDVN